MGPVRMAMQAGRKACKFLGRQAKRFAPVLGVGTAVAGSASARAADIVLEEVAVPADIVGGFSTSYTTFYLGVIVFLLGAALAWALYRWIKP